MCGRRVALRWLDLSHILAYHATEKVHQYKGLQVLSGLGGALSCVHPVGALIRYSLLYAVENVEVYAADLLCMILQATVDLDEKELSHDRALLVRCFIILVHHFTLLYGITRYYTLLHVTTRYYTRAPPEWSHDRALLVRCVLMTITT